MFCRRRNLLRAPLGERRRAPNPPKTWGTWRLFAEERRDLNRALAHPPGMPAGLRIPAQPPWNPRSTRRKANAIVVPRTLRQPRPTRKLTSPRTSTPLRRGFARAPATLKQSRNAVCAAAHIAAIAVARLGVHRVCQRERCRKASHAFG
jgi:hypothetical protein